MLCRDVACALPVTAGAIAVALSACGGGTPMPASPAGDGTTLPLEAPAHHGLAPFERFKIAPGMSEEHGNVVISCPAGGRNCVLRVASNGSFEYERAGGLPSVSLLAFTAEDIEDALTQLWDAVGDPALVWRAVRYPAPDAVTCKALLIDCEGGLGPLHSGSPGDFDARNFEPPERRQGVPLGARTRTSKTTGEATHRALAGWMDHEFFLPETPHAGIPPGDAPAQNRYYGACSVGKPRADGTA